MTFSSIVGQEDAKLALILNAIDPRCGGVLFVGEKGSGKSTLARSFAELTGEGRPFVELPLNATEDAVLGDADLENTLITGTEFRRPGLLERAAGGTLYIDDVNLLLPEIIALVSKGQADCILMATMNPEEGALSSHFVDRFGMCVLVEALKEAPKRVAVMRQAMEPIPSCPSGSDDGLADSREKIESARKRLGRVAVPADVLDYLVRQCMENLVSGHRADIRLFYAARAYAVYLGTETVTEAHVDAVLPLVLAHRRRVFQEPEARQDLSNREAPPDGKNGKDSRDAESGSETQQEGKEQSSRLVRDELYGVPRESAAAEEVFGVGEDFKTRRLTFRKDRMNRTMSGRRTKTGSRGKRGRHVKSILRDNNDIAVDATIRAAAPFQKLRGRKGMLIIRDEDLRYKQREKRMGHLIVFVVDGSGSMGVSRRMIETKGAVQSLLMDCYQKREMVAMIVFRKDRAETVLPPTASVETASKRLREIPVGGKTPLAAGLLETFNLIRRVRIKSEETRFLVVVITDGRANHSLSGVPVREEIKKMTEMLRSLPATDYIVVDTEDKTKIIRTDFAREISSALDGDYYRIDDLKADYLTAVVRKKMMSM